jgi:hypothetical protein
VQVQVQRSAAQWGRLLRLGVGMIPALAVLSASVVNKISEINLQL